MFEWLEQEILMVKTPRFHVIDGPIESALKKKMLVSDLPLPLSYRQFVIEFGNAKLYHRAANDGYRIGVFGEPREARLRDGVYIYHLGFHDGASVYVKPEPGEDEYPIYEFEVDTEDKVAENFEEWLTTSCARVRKQHSKAKWAEILRGPEPFTLKEIDVIEARRQIRWRVLGIDSFQTLIFEVKNTSSRTLAVLSVGIRSKNWQLNGAIRLKIGHIGPGLMDVVHADCYKDLVSPYEVEAFSLPDPRPEDREWYKDLEDIHES